MSALLNYFIEVNLGLVLFYLLYQLLLRRETDFRANRIYLIASIVASLVFPLFAVNAGVQTNAIPSMSLLLPELVITATGSAPTATWEQTTRVFPLLLFGYGIITLLFLGYFLFQLARLIFFLVNSPSKNVNGLQLIETSEKIPPFSFFNWVVIGQMDLLSADDREQILKHEHAHAAQWHSVDLLIVNVLRCLFWVNPIVWLYKQTLEQLHEFEADQRSTDERSLLPYCTVLAKVAMAQSGFAMAHHFNKSLTLKRIKMMNTLKQQMKRWKVMTAFAIAVVFFFMVACQDQLSERVTSAEGIPASVEARLNELKNSYPSAEFIIVEWNEEGRKTIDKLKADPKKLVRTEFIQVIDMGTEPYKTYAIIERFDLATTGSGNDGTIYSTVDESATPAFGFSSFYEQIAQQLKYPLIARQMGIEGRVYVEFVVNKDGILSNFKILKGINEACDNEALRVVMLSQKWHPGRHKGAFINQRMVLPITFSMGNNSTGKIGDPGMEAGKLEEIVVAGIEGKN